MVSKTIDEVLAWAYGRELVRVERGAVASAIQRDREIVRSCGQDPLERMRETGLLVDISPNAFGVIPDFTDERAPHADALAVAAAALELDGYVVSDLSEVDMLGEAAFSILSGVERRRAHEDGAAMALRPDGRLRSRLSVGIVSAAVLGRFRSAPAFIGEIERRDVRVRGKTAWFRLIAQAEGEGRPAVEVEVDGFDWRAQRPYPAAYRKTELVCVETDEPVSLASIVAERIEYQAWRLALDALTEMLAGRLRRFDVRPSSHPYWPWLGQKAPAERRILPALRKGEIEIPCPA